MDFYQYAYDSPADLRDPFGLYTLQLGLAVNYTLFGGTGSFFGGLVIDDQFHLAWYDGWGVGLGEGAGFSGGGSLQVSNANTACGIGGPFAQASGTFGMTGLGGTGDYFTGPGDGPNGIVDGGGATIGIAGGGAASAQRTVTYVHPFGRYSCDQNGKLQPR